MFELGLIWCSVCRLVDVVFFWLVWFESVFFRVFCCGDVGCWIIWYSVVLGIVLCGWVYLGFEVWVIGGGGCLLIYRYGLLFGIVWWFCWVWLIDVCGWGYWRKWFGGCFYVGWCDEVDWEGLGEVVGLWYFFVYVMGFYMLLVIFILILFYVC